MDNNKRQYVLTHTEKLFYQIYVQDVIKDGFGEGPKKEEIEQICKHISQAVSMLYDHVNGDTFIQ